MSALNDQSRSFRYRITHVGSQEPNGSRVITTHEMCGTLDIEGNFSVTPEQLAAYTPNAGDTLIRDDDGNIRFESCDEDIRFLYSQQPETGVWIEVGGPYSQEVAEARAEEAFNATGQYWHIAKAVSEDGRTLIK